MNDLIVSVPIRGSILLRFDGSDDLHEVGRFEHQVPVSFAKSGGITTVHLSKSEGEQ
jgi:hypothetical protein